MIVLLKKDRDSSEVNPLTVCIIQERQIWQ